MNDQALRFRFGIFVLASMILLAILIILFGGFPAMFKRVDTYIIEFDNAHGAAPGTPVRKSGVRIGDVRSVTLDSDTGKVRVEIRVDHQYTLHKSDRPTLVQGLLGGDATIAMLPPENKKLEDKTPVPPDSTVRGYTPTDAGALVQKAGDLVTPATDALVEVRKVFQRIDKMAPMMEEAVKDFRDVSKVAVKLSPELEKTNLEIQIAARNWGKVGKTADDFLNANEAKISKSIERLEDTLKKVNELFTDENQKNLTQMLKRINDVLSDENTKNFTATLRNVKNSSDQFESITKNTGELIKETRVTMKQVNDSLKRADDAIADLQRALKPLGEKGPGMLKNLDDSADNLNKTLKDMRELIQIVARSDGTVQKLLSDPSLYNNLNDSAVMVTKILPRLDRVLRDVEIFADKLARHPELLGISGVVRPSSGLKEPPFRIYP